MNELKLGELPQIECEPLSWRVLREFYPQYGVISGGVTVERREGAKARTV